MRSRLEADLRLARVRLRVVPSARNTVSLARCWRRRHSSWAFCGRPTTARNRLVCQEFEPAGAITVRVLDADELAELIGRAGRSPRADFFRAVVIDEEQLT